MFSIKCLTTGPQFVGLCTAEPLHRKTFPVMKTKLSMKNVYDLGKTHRLCVSTRLLFLILALSPVPCALSQIPQGFNYQAIARDGTGNILPNTPLQAMMYIQSESIGGTIFWKELHSTITTNDFGLFTLVIGTGTRQIESTVATFDLIDWSVTPKYLKTQIYYDGSWKDMGASQLYSVPYALRAKNSEQWLTSGTDIYRLNGNVGIGTNIPGYKFEVVGRSRILGDGTNSSGFWYSNLAGTLNRGFIGMYTDNLIGFNGAGGVGWGLVMDVNNGNVGIGTTTPAGKLHVKGDIWLPYNSGNSVLTMVMGNGNGMFFKPEADAIHIQSNHTGSPTIMFLSKNGYVGIGTTTPVSNLDVSGDIRATNKIWADVSGATGSYFRGGNDAELWDVGVANTLAIYGVQNSAVATLRLGSGSADISGSNGNIGIGTTTPTSKMVIQPSASWDDNTPLFEVKNKTGVPIFAVYNNGVRILIDHSESKGIKSGFAVGGYDMTKAGKTVDFMNISPDSIRFNINNDNVKGKKGGFAVGGYDLTKKGPINQDFMYITPQTSDNGQYNTFLGLQGRN